MGRTRGSDMFTMGFDVFPSVRCSSSPQAQCFPHGAAAAKEWQVDVASSLASSPDQTVDVLIFLRQAKVATHGSFEDCAGDPP